MSPFNGRYLHTSILVLFLSFKVFSIWFSSMLLKVLPIPENVLKVRFACNAVVAFDWIVSLLSNQCPLSAVFNFEIHEMWCGAVRSVWRLAKACNIVLCETLLLAHNGEQSIHHLIKPQTLFFYLLPVITKIILYKQMCNVLELSWNKRVHEEW